MPKRNVAQEPLINDDTFVIARILWEDAAHIPYWQDGNDGVHMEPMRCVTVGMVISESTDRITVAQTVSKDNHAHRIQIPTTCIINVKVIGRIKKDCAK